MKLPMPVICECGFTTMDAKRAIEHANHHERMAKQEKQLKHGEKLLAKSRILLAKGKEIKNDSASR